MLTLTRADKSFETQEERKKTRYVVAHDGLKVYHAIELFPYLQVSTGLKYLESFDAESEALEKFPDLSFRPIEPIEDAP